MTTTRYFSKKRSEKECSRFMQIAIYVEKISREGITVFTLVVDISTFIVQGIVLIDADQ